MCHFGPKHIFQSMTARLALEKLQLLKDVNGAPLAESFDKLHRKFLIVIPIDILFLGLVMLKYFIYRWSSSSLVCSVQYTVLSAPSF